ncbi:MAG: ABC transporter permease [Actinobacteria bacterium]|nr:ABC transporter permease [Actinomycetota bacterium]
MIVQLASRVVSSLLAVIGASIVSFLLLRIAPSNPATLILGQFASQEAIDNLTEEIGLEKPIWTQYWNYISGFVRGDWGYSYSLGTDVRSLLGAKLPATIELGLYAFVFAFVGALVLALLATYRRRPLVDGGVRGLSFLGLGIPPFWFGLMSLVLLSEGLGWFPGPDGRLDSGVAPPRDITGLYTLDALVTGNWAAFGDALWHLVLPAITLGLAPMGFLLRLLRANLLDVSREPFLLVVRSKGISRWTAFARHALPNAFLPTLTAAGLVLGQLLAGSVLVEKVFNWPGAGALVTDGILRQDFTTVQAFILLSAFVYVIVNLLVDIASAAIDPRIRAPRSVG